MSSIKNQSHTEKVHLLNKAALRQIAQRYEGFQAQERFIPFMAMHEFEALLFSDEAILANALAIDMNAVKAIVEACGEPEKINNNPATAPSKRLDQLKPSGKFKKATEGIFIAEQNRYRQNTPTLSAF